MLPQIRGTRFWAFTLSGLSSQRDLSPFVTWIHNGTLRMCPVNIGTTNLGTTVLSSRSWTTMSITIRYPSTNCKTFHLDTIFFSPAMMGSNNCYKIRTVTTGLKPVPDVPFVSQDDKCSSTPTHAHQTQVTRVCVYRAASPLCAKFTYLTHISKIHKIACYSKLLCSTTRGLNPIVTTRIGS